MSFIEQKALKYLTPPGNGIFTGHQISDIKLPYQKKLYQHIENDLVQKAWKHSLENLLVTKKPLLLGIPSDCGGAILRGANWGAIAIRNQINYLERYLDLGDIKCIPHFIYDNYLSQDTIQKARVALYGINNGYPVSPLSITKDFTEDLYLLAPDAKIIGLGGDNSISHPLINAWIKKCMRNKKRFAIIHLDAHTDFMSQRLGVEVTFGSWAYQIAHDLEKPQHFIQVGIRASHHDQFYWESHFGIKQFWAHEIKKNKNFTKEFCDYLINLKADEVYLSIDMDVLDPSYAGATGSPEKDGIEPHHVINLIEAITQLTPITAADISEVSPYSHQTDFSPLTPEPETTLLSSKLILEKIIEVMQWP